MRRAKIIATIGPRTESPEMLRKLILSGIDLARLNFSHGDAETHARTISNIKRISAELNRPVGILQDLQGVKIRTGPLEGDEPVELKKNATFTLTTRPIEGNEKVVSTGYKPLPEDVQEGDRILISDGLIELEVLSSDHNTDIECRVVHGGLLAPNQGINAPRTLISAPPLTDKDREDVRFGIEQEVDYMALSFVRRAGDIRALREILGRSKADIHIIAKLEKPRAIHNLDAILEVCDGVMIARGDLGVEVAPERVPILQKRIIRSANKKGKPVITATQMLESMIESPRPTRAEASDVANAVFDGTDALMLSAETATGAYPIESVEMMKRIIEAAETTMESPQILGRGKKVYLSFPDAVCEAAFHASQAIRTRAVCAFTQSGSTASAIAKYRPDARILGITPEPRIMRRMCLYWGVRPVQMQHINHVDQLIETLERTLRDRGMAESGDNLVILTGAPIQKRGHVSLMKLHRVQ